MPKDIGFAMILIGLCGPLIAGYLITIINSVEKIKIDSKPIFFTVFIVTALVLFLRLYFVNNGWHDINGNVPDLNEVSILGYICFGIVLFILAINFSNATNLKLKENYIKSSLFEKGKVKWYIIGVFLLILLCLGSYFMGDVLGMETTDFVVKPEPILLVGFFSSFFFLGGNEEFGWRGFLQKELQKKYNPLIGTLAISFLWSLWHLPLHYNGFYSTGGFVDLLPRFAWTIPLTIIFTWLYNKSSYSVLAVMLLHATVNNISRAFGYSEIILTVLAFLFTVFCIINDKMWQKKNYNHIYENNITD
ncbi:type II CAAX endopeptidase family protein [Winogradskyella aurantia]|uniref:type II CAAX endopeptidase family protein n=1 Tax=Winogradskyella aurantia TaxID=1915063 RepID=UPI0013FE4B7E|nr:type II CAAX endopeptidase family protein [Winogradskyella aurantia]